MPSNPRFLDLQVNGYAGIDFNQDNLTPDQLHRACARLREDGVTSILATIITEELALMGSRLSRLADLRGRDPLVADTILGLHIEGPFINQTDGYRGAHPREAVRPADVDSMQRLLDAARGLTTLVTLAPEADPTLAVTRRLANQGIAVSAGHCNPTLDQLRASIDAGLALFTHLGNGCPMLLPRHDNIIQRALSLSDRLYITFIADGAHVPFFALANYLRLVPPDRAIIVSDAIAPAGLGPGRYTLGRWDLLIGPDLVARAPDGSHLVGSALSLPRAAENLREHLSLPPDQIQNLTLHNPRQALNLGRSMSP